MVTWIFTVTQHKTRDGTLSPEDIFTRRMEDMFWGLGERTPNRKSLAPVDKIVFYLGNPIMSFAGTAALSSSSFRLSAKEKEKYSRGNPFFSPEYGVLLDEISIWSKYKPVKELVPILKFIKNKSYWGTYFQGGIRQVNETDFLIIQGDGTINLSEQLRNQNDLEDENDFALEAHLEEFLFRNWEKIDWGINLKLYESDEQNGRQYPAGSWSIDFLAEDTDTNELVVIELKRGKSSDSTVGQILRYIN